MNTAYLQFKVADLLSRMLPRRFAYWVGLRIADEFYARDTRGRNAVKSNLRHILRHKGLRASDETLERLTRRVFQHFGKHLIDFFSARRISLKEVNRMVSIEHHEYLEQAMSADTGIIVLTAHLGSWELGAAVLATLGCPLNAVILPEEDRRIRALFTARRESRVQKVIPLGQAARGVLKALSAKEPVALLADRDYSPRSDLVEFFGTPTRLPRGPATISAKTGCPILPGFLLRQPDDTFLFRFHPLILPHGRGSGPEIQKQIVAILEKEIGRTPEQWFMFHDFWDTNAPLSRGVEGTNGTGKDG